MATEQNIGPDDHYFSGEDKRLPFVIYQSDGVTPQDITGWSLSWMVKAARTDADADALLTLTTDGAEITLTTPATGAGEVEVDESDIADMAASTRYFHELKRIDSGFKTVLIHGTLRLGQAVHD